MTDKKRIMAKKIQAKITCMSVILTLLAGTVGGCALQTKNSPETESESEAGYGITADSESENTESENTESENTESENTESKDSETGNTESENTEGKDSETENSEKPESETETEAARTIYTGNGQSSALPYYALPTEQTVIVEEPYPGDETADSSETASTENASTESVSTETTEAAEPGYYSRNLIMIDVDAHEILAQKDPYERINPASMTKMMELLVAAEQLTEKDLDRTITVSQEAIDYSYENGCSVAGFEAGDEVTMRDLLYGTILPSGGEASCQLALELAGSMEGFADLMNQKAMKLGIGDTTHFTNSVGLYDEEHYSTVYDMAIIMEAVMDTVIGKEVITTVVYQMGSTIQYPKGYSLHNAFLEAIAEKGLPGTVIAAKTGYISQSRKCAASCYQAPDGKLYVAVTAGAYAETIAGQTKNCILDHVKLYTNYAP